MDIKSAYLNAKLKEEIYMVPPPGLNTPDRMVLRLVKAVYRMKQGRQMWYQDICAMLEEMGYTHLESNHTVFIQVRDSTLSIIVVGVSEREHCMHKDTKHSSLSKDTHKHNTN
jgi:Reverse transcriptase (RNA-dependent DNA polymerase)